MKEVVGAAHMIEVFTDEFAGRRWVNICKLNRIIKINPDLIEEIIRLLREAKEKLI